ncbi:phage protein GemA/Gp16 family protein [uncultured Acetobacteroides sp.]|uniref:phage protein GemA/Gp16 family protein n=1 Tax=uncultured Acetobacteroides sp. TaxID=1760811 RepID=UPI0029F59723|nr:phage protein GemA/Gp16 family protein [uncultured Acetobacteroides sp.]
MQTVHEKYLIKRLHTLFGRLGFDKESKREMLFENYGVTSSTDLTSKQLAELCDKLECELNPQKRELDKYRKRVIAAIGGWLTAMGRENDIKLIKSIACRAAETKAFNDIPLERLRSIYNAFIKKQKDLKFVDNLTKAEIEVASYLN